MEYLLFVQTSKKWSLTMGSLKRFFEDILVVTTHNITAMSRRLLSPGLQTGRQCLNDESKSNRHSLRMFIFMEAKWEKTELASLRFSSLRWIPPNIYSERGTCSVRSHHQQLYHPEYFFLALLLLRLRFRLFLTNIKIRNIQLNSSALQIHFRVQMKKSIFITASTHEADTDN
jgi:hypothetical protein